MITSSPPPHYHFLGILSISRNTKPALASGPLRLPLPLPGTPSPATLLRWSPPPLSNAANPHSHSISYPNLTTPRAGVGHLLHQSTSSRAGGLPGPLSTAQPAAQPLGTWWVAANAHGRGGAAALGLLCVWLQLSPWPPTGLHPSRFYSSGPTINCDLLWI